MLQLCRPLLAHHMPLVAGACTSPVESLLARCFSVKSEHVSQIVSLRNFRTVAGSGIEAPLVIPSTPLSQPSPPHGRLNQRVTGRRHEAGLQASSSSLDWQRTPRDATQLPTGLSSNRIGGCNGGRSSHHSRTRSSEGNATQFLAERLEDLANTGARLCDGTKAAEKAPPFTTRSGSDRGGRHEQRHKDPCGTTSRHIPSATIPEYAWIVMRELHAAGHETFLVGGAVRDVLLGGTPKDFDILTSASMLQVRRLFKKTRWRCMIVGKRFPICHIMMRDKLVEVSSFATSAEETLPPDRAALARSSRFKAKRNRKNALLAWSGARRENALARDFTVNGLLFDPFSKVLYDYVGGVRDCDTRTLRTIGDAEASFAADPARILRAIRLSARAGLSLDENTAAALVAQAPQVATVAQGRLSMEIAALFSFGAAAPTVALLWRFRLLDMLLPLHAAHMARHRAARNPKVGSKQPPLMRAMAALDAHIDPVHPASPVLWVAALAAPLLADLTRKRGRPRKNSAAEMDQGCLDVEVKSLLRQMTLAHTSAEPSSSSPCIGPLLPKRMAEPATQCLLKAMQHTKASAVAPRPRGKKERAKQAEVEMLADILSASMARRSDGIPQSACEEPSSSADAVGDP